MTENGRTALVLGATGGVGGAVAEALTARGWSVRGLARDPDRAASGWAGRRGSPEWLGGDAIIREDVVRAAEGADVIVHAVNPPGYRRWDELVLPMIDNTIAAARAAGGARIVLPGTIYNYDPAETPVIDEHTPQAPRTRKGAIRVELERRLELASEDTPTLVVRAGDFFGPRMGSSWFGQAMVRRGKPVRRVLHPGLGVGHAWAYLPDLAQAVARLLDVPERLRRFERLQFAGQWDGSGYGMVAAVQRAVGFPAAAHRFPWWLMHALAPFGGFPREALEIEPFWRHPVRLDGNRLAELIGPEPRTPMDEAVARTLAAMGCLGRSHAAQQPAYAYA